MEDASHSRPASRVLVCGVVLALALGLSWPWIAVLDLWPMATDTGPWIQRGDPATPGWQDWVFRTRHFQVGYRPVTALSFTLCSWLAEPSPWIVRGLDLAIHLAGALALFLLLVRVLAGRGAVALAAGTGLVAFLLHPAVEEVVPFSARRSYSLALALGCAGLLVGSGVGTSRGRALLRQLVSALLLALALLSNEVAGGAIVFLPVLRWLADRRELGGLRRWWEACAASLLPAAAVGLAFLARWRVVGGLGGYRVEDDVPERASAILQSLASDLAGAGFVDGAPGVGLGLGLLLALGLAGAWRALGPDGPQRWAAPAAGLWLLIYGLLFSGQGVWYPRQAHALLPALGLALACLVQALVTGRGPGRAIAGLALASWLVAIGVASPVLRGMQAERQEKWALRQELIEVMLQAGELEPGSRVLCVLPFRRPESSELKANIAKAKLPRDARQPLVWAQYLLEGSGVSLAEFLYVYEQDWSMEQSVELALEEKRPSVTVPVDREVMVVRIRNPKRRKPKQGPLEALPPRPAKGATGPTWLFRYGAGGGTLVPALP